MQSEFEKKIQLTMEEFALTPSDAVWQNVEVRISKERRRRRLIFYWVAAVILIAGGAGLWVAAPVLKDKTNKNISHKTDKTPAKNTAANNVDKSNKPARSDDEKTLQQQDNSKPIAGVNVPDEGEKETSKNDDNVTANINGNKPGKSNAAPPSDKIKSGNRDSKEPKSTANAGRKKQNEFVAISGPAVSHQQRKAGDTKELKSPSTAISKDVTQKNKTSDKTLEGTAGEDKTVTNNQVKTVGNNTDIAVETNRNNAAKTTDTTSTSAEPTLNPGKVEAATSKSDSSLPATVATVQSSKIASEINKKMRFGVTVFSGISDNKSGFPLFSEKSYNDALYSNIPQNSTGSNGGSSGNTAASLEYRTGFSYGFGVFAEKPLSKKWSLTAGIDYHYLSTLTKIAGKVSASQNLFDSVLSTNRFVDAYYVSSFSNGQMQSQAAAHFTNKYHYIQLPVNLQLQLNSTHHKPLLLTAGLTPGILFSTRALYYNKSAGRTYIENSQFRKFQLNTQAGLLFTLTNTKKYNINLGPQIIYGLSNLTKPATQTSQHLFFFGLKSNITFKPRS